MTFQTTYNLAMALCDEMATGGVVNAATTKSYLSRAPHLLTMLHSEVSHILDIPAVEIALTDEPQCGEYVTLTVLPFGLAAMLLADENPQLASFYQQRFEDAKRRIPITPKPIVDVFGIRGGVR